MPEMDTHGYCLPVTAAGRRPHGTFRGLIALHSRLRPARTAQPPPMKHIKQFLARSTNPASRLIRTQAQLALGVGRRSKPTEPSGSLAAIASKGGGRDGDADHSCSSWLRSSFSPFATMRSALSGRGRCSSSASIVSASDGGASRSGPGIGSGSILRRATAGPLIVAAGYQVLDSDR